MCEEMRLARTHWLAQNRVVPDVTKEADRKTIAKELS
jgi:hypothetical protein